MCRFRWRGSVRILVSAAQYMPFAVRTMFVVDLGRLVFCHQSPAPLSRTIQPRRGVSGLAGRAGAGVVMAWIVAGSRASYSRLDPDKRGRTD